MQRSDAGFSLIELLVSLTILASVSLMLMAGLNLGKQLWQREARVLDSGQNIAAVQSALRESIEQLTPVTRYDASAPYSDLNGTADSLEYLSRAADARQPNPLLRYKLTLNNKGQLLLTGRNDLAFSATEAGAIAPVADRSVLLQQVRNLQIDYYGRRQGILAKGWSQRWQSQTRPPELIRIRITFMPGTKIDWPDLVVRPATMVDIDCVLVPVSARCQGRA